MKQKNETENDTELDRYEGTQFNMITAAIKQYQEDIIEMAYRAYLAEFVTHSGIQYNEKEVFRQMLLEQMEEMQGCVLIRDKKCTGYLLYNAYEYEGQKCDIPVWGIGTSEENREKAISKLFQFAAGQVVKEGTVEFSVHLYANDLIAQRLFSYMEFGMQAETGVRALQRKDLHSEDISAGYQIHFMEKEVLQNRWDEVWSLLQKLIEHLTLSPVFYPGREFTEDVYKEFFMDPATCVYVAEVKGQLIGMIETNSEAKELVSTQMKSCNIGEVYVLPEYRQTGVAADLLFTAKNTLCEQNVAFDWVEHGTANANARRFWGTYFETYEYEMIRKIEAV